MLHVSAKDTEVDCLGQKKDIGSQFAKAEVLFHFFPLHRNSVELNVVAHLIENAAFSCMIFFVGL